MRLLKARRGDFTGADPAPGAFVAAPGTQKYQYDFVGNIRSTDILANASEQQSAADRKLTASFNAVNEQTNYVETIGGGGSLGSTFAITHDAAGNVRTRETVAGGNRLAYRHDRWGRLTEVKFEVRSGSSYLANDRARYRYNALGMRALVERDADTTDPTNAINERRYLYYNAAWQIVEEHVDAGVTSTSSLSIDRIVQNVWGLRYIDDLVLRRVDANYLGSSPPSFAETASGDIDWEQYLTDHQFSVVAAVGRTGTLAFRVAYDAFGEARHLPAKDINGDGKVDRTDTTLAQGALGKTLGQPGYNPDADWDRDGTVTTRDVAQYGSTAYVTALPQGQLAPAANVSAPLSAANARSDFNIGYCGYRFNGDIGAYTVRFRHYDLTPGMCRWLERDPAGYQDGPSLYSYLGRNPMAGTDPYGLEFWDNAAAFGRGLVKGAVWGVALGAAAAVGPVAAVAVGVYVVASAAVTIYETDWENLSEEQWWELGGTVAGGAGTLRGGAKLGRWGKARIPPALIRPVTNPGSIMPPGAALRAGGALGAVMGRNKPGGTPKPSPHFRTPTNPPSLPKIPRDFVAERISTGGTIHRRPGSTGTADTIRTMPPTRQYPDGYWVQCNKHGQPINPKSGRTGPREDTHIPLPPRRVPGWFVRPWVEEQRSDEATPAR